MHQQSSMSRPGASNGSLSALRRQGTKTKEGSCMLGEVELPLYRLRLEEICPGLPRQACSPKCGWTLLMESLEP